MGTYYKELLSTVIITMALFLSKGCSDPAGPGNPTNAPRDLTATLVNKTVELNWDHSVNGSETGYEIWRSVNDKSSFRLVESFTKEQLTYTDVTVEFNNVYYYKVSAIYEGGSGYFSETVMVSTEPSAPTDLKATFTGTALKLNWKPTNGRFETGYEVWRSDDNGLNYEVIATVDSDQQEYSDLSIIRQRTYFYKVRTIIGEEPGIYSDYLPTYAGYLWLSSYILYDGGGDAFYIEKIDPNSKNVIVSFHPPRRYCYGLAYDGTYLWTGEYASTNPEIFKINPFTGDVEDSFILPGSKIRIKGLTYDGSELWVLAGSDIFEIVPNTGEVLRSFPAPDTFYEGDLAFDGDYLWLAGTIFRDYFGQGKLYKIDPYTGSVLASFSLYSGGSGVTWDGFYLWISSGGIRRVNPNTGQSIFNFDLYRQENGLAIE